MNKNSSKTGTNRLQYLDWVRGLGAIIMLQGHAFDSFLKSDLRAGGAFIYSQFVGGMPPAIFLFLTGVTLAFLMDSTERKGLGNSARVLGVAPPRRVPLRARIRLSRANVAFRMARSVDRPVQSRHPQLHGLRDRGDVRDGAVPNGRARPALRHSRTRDCGCVARDLAVGLVVPAGGAASVHRAGLPRVQLLPLGRVPRFRNERGQRSPCDAGGSDRARDAMGSAVRRRVDRGLPVLFQPAVFDLYEVGVSG